MSKRKVDRHHTVPRTRGGDDSDIVMWDKKFHASFHMIFLNMTPREQHEFLDEINVPGEVWNAKRLCETRNRIMRGKGR